MAVSPDLLLNIKTPEARNKASAAKTDSASQASRQEASRFAEMYARERQGKPVERQQAPARAEAEKPVKEKNSQETAETEAAESPAVAEGGKALPLEREPKIEQTPEPEAVAEAELDPLLMFGMGVSGEAGEAAETPASDARPVGSEFMLGLQQALAIPASEEDLAVEEPAAEQKLQLQSPTAGRGEVQSVTKGDALFASLQQAASEPAQASDELELDLALAPGETEDADSPADSRQSNVELSANRLNPLAQAIAQQTQQLQRPMLAPGQPVQMQQAGWSEAVVDRVMWLSSQNLKSAEIQLDPAELGRMEVRIDMTKDQAHVTFLSPHAGVREALEGQMQRLRDMFSQQGMTMDVNVSDQSLARGQQGEDGGNSRGQRGGADSALAELESGGVLEVSSNRAGGDRGLVDFYA